MTSVKRLWNTLFGKPSAEKKKGKKEKEAAAGLTETSSNHEESLRKPGDTLPASWISEPDEDSKHPYVFNPSMVDSSHSTMSQAGEMAQRLFSRATHSTSVSVQVPARFHTTNQSWASQRSSNNPIPPATPPLPGSTVDTIRAARSPKSSRHGNPLDAPANDSLNLSEMIHTDYDPLESLQADPAQGQHSAHSSDPAHPLHMHPAPFTKPVKSNKVVAITEEAGEAAAAANLILTASGNHLFAADRTAAVLAPSTPGSSRAAASPAATPIGTPQAAPSTPDQPGQTHKLRYVEQWLAEAEGSSSGANSRKATTDSSTPSTSARSEPEGRVNGHVVQESLRARSGGRPAMPAAQPVAAEAVSGSSHHPAHRSTLQPDHRPPLPPHPPHPSQSAHPPHPSHAPHVALASQAPHPAAHPAPTAQAAHSTHSRHSNSKSAWLHEEAVHPSPASANALRHSSPAHAATSPAGASALRHPSPAPAAMSPSHPTTSKLNPQVSPERRASSPESVEENSPSDMNSQLVAENTAQNRGKGNASQRSKNVTVKVITVAKHCPPDIITGSWSIHDFDILKKCYEGHLSVVCHVRHKVSGRHLAMKIYKRSRLQEMERYQLAREICMHVRITQPNIVSLYAAWKDPSYVYLAMEWAPRGNLFDYLVGRGGKLPEAEAARNVMQPLLAALVHIHGLNFIHRDIKLENILLSEDLGVKLADFGLAIDHNYEVANTRLGTFGYFAPEVLDCPLKQSPFDYKDQTQLGYDHKVDVWSLGVLCFELLTGKGPFSAPTAQKIIQAIRNRVIHYPDSLSPEAKDFIQMALQRNSDKRASAKQLLTHPWITQHCPAAAALPPGQATTPSDSPRGERPAVPDVPGAVH